MIPLPKLGVGRVEVGEEYFHLNKRSVFVLDFAAGLPLGGHRLGGNTCL